MASTWISAIEMASAQPLFFRPISDPGATGWDQIANFSTLQANALLRDDFLVTLTKGATYDIFSASFFDPFVLRIQDFNGSLLANDNNSLSVSYGMDVIWDFIAPYTGIYYISASWDQGFSDPFVYVAVYEDIDTAPIMPPNMTINIDGVASQVSTTQYSGPVAYLQYQYIGGALGEVVNGTAGNDFINLLGGDDAAAGEAGDDVLDGGTGSNFLSGGNGRDVFFIDGRGGSVTWATITDWRPGEEVVVWGWRPGVSKWTSVESEGAPGYKGGTMHADLDGNGVIDTSVTASGKSLFELPPPLELDGLLWFI